MTDRLQALSDAGVSIWLDDLSRERIETGNLAELIKETLRRRRDHQPDDLRRRDRRRRALRRAGRRAGRRRRRRRRGDLRAHHRGRPQRLRRPAPRSPARPRADGRVSIEVEPDLANDTDATIASARALWQAVDRPNVLIKIPATEEGLPRDHRRDRRGHQRQRHADLLRGALPRGHGRLPDRPRAGPRRRASTSARIQSVASFFVSRVDTEVDTRLDEIGTAEALDAARQGGGRQRPARLRRVRGGRSPPTAGRRWPTPAPTPSARCGPRPGSRTPTTPTPSTSPTSWSADTVNTMPEKTLEAFADHGEVRGDVVTGRDEEGRAVLARLEEVGVDFADVLAVLEQRGRRQVREVLAGARRDRPRPDGAGERVTRAMACDESRAIARQHARRVRSTRRSSTASSPTGSRAGSRTATPPCGAEAAVDEAAKRLAWVGLQPDLARPGHRDLDAGRRARASADSPASCSAGWAARRSRPRSSAPPPAWSSTCSTPPSPTSSDARSRTASARRSWWCPRKSGGTVETDSQRRAFEQAFRDAGHRPGRADRGRHRPRAPRWRSPPARPATGSSWPTRTSAGATPRSPPSAWCRAGWPAPTSPVCSTRPRRSAPPWRPTTPTTPGCVLGALLGRGQPRRASTSSCSPTPARRYPGLGDWAEQLVAESTGKDGKGILPVVVELARRAAAQTARHARRTARDVRRGPGRRQRRRGRLRLERPPRPAARRAAARVGVRHRRRRPAARDQPVRPARRRERQGGRPQRCSTAPQTPRTPVFIDGPVTVYASDGLAARGHRHRRRRGGGAAGHARPRPRLPRGPGLPRPAPRRLARRAPRPAGAAHRPSGHLRLGPAVPALDRPVPQGRARDRRLPPGHLRTRRRPRRARAAPSPSRSSSPPRRSVTGRCSPTTAARCCGCTWSHPPASTSYARRSAEDGRRDDLAATRCATRGTGGCPASPGPAAWCCSASPATCRARS